MKIAIRFATRLGHPNVEIPSPLGLPPFRPTDSHQPPVAVIDFQNALRSADVVLIAAPEYAAGVAGSTKNALDWLVGDATLYHTLVGVLSAGTTGGPYAIEQLVRTLSWQGALPVATLGISSPRTKTSSDGVFTDDQTCSEIEEWTATVINAALGSPGHRANQIARTVAVYGIDPARFGSIE